MRKIFLPLLFLFLFIFESTFIQLLPVEVFNGERIIAPRFLLVALLFMAMYGNGKHGVFYAFLFGLLFDVIYTEIIGIYLFLFPLIVTIAAKLMKILQSNIVVVSILALVGVTLLELGVYEMNFLLNKTQMTFSFYAVFRLIPTLILNLTFIILFSYPLKVMSEKYAKYLLKD